MATGKIVSAEYHPMLIGESPLHGVLLGVQGATSGLVWYDYSHAADLGLLPTKDEIFFNDIHAVNDWLSRLVGKEISITAGNEPTFSEHLAHLLMSHGVPAQQARKALLEGQQQYHDSHNEYYLFAKPIHVTLGAIADHYAPRITLAARDHNEDALLTSIGDMNNTLEQVYNFFEDMGRTTGVGFSIERQYSGMLPRGWYHEVAHSPLPIKKTIGTEDLHDLHGKVSTVHAVKHTYERNMHVGLFSLI
ncbi:TPA: hypothetical protein HA245_03290 [Candidatus Woesearchaeota archaeon]|nr:hypothetical protein [Candidatus Woesearchaeota archaeon]